MVKRTRTSAASGRKPADPDYPSGRSTTARAAQVIPYEIYYYAALIHLSISPRRRRDIKIKRSNVRPSRIRPRPNFDERSNKRNTHCCCRARGDVTRVENTCFFFFSFFSLRSFNLDPHCSSRNQSVRRGEVRPLRAVRDQPTGDSELRMRGGMRAGDEAGVRERWQDLHLVVRAEEAGLFDEEQHRGRVHWHVRLQGPLLREGQSSKMQGKRGQIFEPCKHATYTR